jgi:hypothetical protein
MQLTKETTSAVAAAPPGDTWHMPSEAVAARYATPRHQPPSTAAGHGGCRRKDWRQACLPPPADRLAPVLVAVLFRFVLFCSVCVHHGRLYSTNKIPGRGQRRLFWQSADYK